MFNNAHQLSSSVKDVGEGADRDDADALGIGEGNCGMNLVRGIVIIIVVIIFSRRIKYDIGFYPKLRQGRDEGGNGEEEKQGSTLR